MSIFYPDLQTHSLCCPADWRWRRACWLTARGRYFSSLRDDAQTGRAVGYLRSLARSRTGRPGTAIFKYYADIHAARQLHEGATPTRLLVQARLLARQSVEEVAPITGVLVPVVHAYAALFFDVLGRLDARDWILLHAIGPKARPVTAIPDTAAVLKSFAFFGGPLVLDAVVPYLVGGKDLFEPPLNLSTVEGRQEQAVRLAVATQLLPGGAGTDGKLHRIMLLLHERERKRLARHATAALLARQADSQVAEVLAGAPSERIDGVERNAPAAVVAAVRETA